MHYDNFLLEISELVNYLETYQRLDRPPLCPKTLHDLMTWCWELGYQLRPSFAEIKEDLKTFQTSQQDSKMISYV